MRTSCSLVLAALVTVVHALAEPAPAHPPRPSPGCTDLPKRCHSVASKYCTAVLTPITKTSYTATTTAFPSDFSCDPNANKARREAPAITALEPIPDIARRAKSTRIPPCFRNFIDSREDPNLTAACSCADVTQSTESTMATGTSTVYNTDFYLRFVSLTDAVPYARETQTAGNTVAIFDQDSASGLSIYHLNSACNLLDSRNLAAYAIPQNQSQIDFYADSSEASADQVSLVWQTYVDFYGVRLYPYAQGEMFITRLDVDTSVWQLSPVPGDPDDYYQGDVFVYPDGTQGDRGDGI